MADQLDEHAPPVNVYQRRTNAKAETFSSSGDNTIRTPESGKYVLLQYLCLSADGANGADVTATVKWAGMSDALYKVSLKPGAIWARNIGAGRRVVTGDVDQALVVNLSVAQSVHVSHESQEY